LPEWRPASRATLRWNSVSAAGPPSGSPSRFFPESAGGPYAFPAAAYPVPDFDRIAARCAFIAHCRDDATTLSEPDWYILLTIAARCRGGRRLAHRLSAPYPRYRAAETEAKIDRALSCTGPYRCGTIARINGRFCQTCSHAGRISSPIRLGYGPPSAEGLSTGEPLPAYGPSAGRTPPAFPPPGRHPILESTFPDMVLPLLLGCPLVGFGPASVVFPHLPPRPDAPGKGPPCPEKKPSPNGSSAM
jgi:hypothetical protein